MKANLRDHTCLPHWMDYARKKIGNARAIPLLIVLMFLVACQEGMTPSESNPLVQVPRISWSSIQNPSNPYNFIGEAHNNGLVYIDQVVHPDSFTVLDQCCQAILDFLQDSTYADNTLTTTRLVDMVDSMAFYEDLYRQRASSDELAFYDLVTYEIQDTSYAVNAQGIDTTLISRLSAVEEQILNSSIPDENKAIPLICVTVAKHSAAYWINVCLSNMAMAGFVGSQQSLFKTQTPPVGPWMPGIYWRLLTPSQKQAVKDFTQEDVRMAGIAASALAVGILMGVPVEPRVGASLIVGAGIAGSIDKATGG